MTEQVYGLLGEGSVIGVIPAELAPREVSGEAVGEIRIVADMHTRKVGCLPCGLHARGTSVPVRDNTLHELLYHIGPLHRQRWLRKRMPSSACQVAMAHWRRVDARMCEPARAVCQLQCM